MSKRLEEFKPLVPGQVGIYSCGPTVYSRPHIGNLRPYIHADIMKRMFRANNYIVNHTINITDVGHLVSDEDTGEDKMEKGARREGKTAWDVAKFYTDIFIESLNALGIELPTNMPRATDYIQQQIDWVRKLEDLGYTYEIPGDGIYFDTSKFPDYGALGHQNLDELKAGARIDVEGKKNHTDFALWKFSPAGVKRDMEWDSPWGKGFPGWHIECSVMSAETLGAHFDIHTGGPEHIKVHHTNEIAQSEPLVGKPWVNYWVHFAWLMSAEGKMSKSAGDDLTIGGLVDKGYNPMAFRYLILLGHYSSQIEFSYAALDAATAGYKNIVRKVASLMEEGGTANQELVDNYKNKLTGIISNNLDTAGVLVAVQELLKSSESAAVKLQVIKFADELLGLQLIEAAEKSRAQITPEIQAIINERIAARAAKDWAKSDELRDKLAAMGIEVNDQKL